jgi:hypothetical protein
METRSTVMEASTIHYTSNKCLAGALVAKQACYRRQVLHAPIKPFEAVVQVLVNVIKDMEQCCNR